MTEAEKETILWLQDHGVKSASFCLVSHDDKTHLLTGVEFWAPPQPAQSKIDISEILGAAVTDDELYGYEVPEHLKDQDDVTQGETK